MPYFDDYFNDLDDSYINGGGSSNSFGGAYLVGPGTAYNYRVRITNTTANTSLQACGQTLSQQKYVGPYVTADNQIGPGKRFRNTQYPYSYYNGQNKYWGLGPIISLTNTPAQWVLVATNGMIIGMGACANQPTPTPTPTPTPKPTPTTTLTPVTPPGSVLQYCYYSVVNESYSKKIFAYYSGSQDFDYKFNYITGSNDPTVGEIRLDSGSIGSGGGTNEKDARFIAIDIQDTGSQEDIVSYLTSLKAAGSSCYGKLRIEVANSSSYQLQYDISGIQTSSITTTGYFLITASNGTGSPSNNPISSSLVDAGKAVTTKQDLKVKFYNDGFPGYHEINIPSTSSVSFVAVEGPQTSSCLPSGSIPAPFNTKWGLAESDFIKDSFYPSGQGTAWLWNDGYKVKHIKLNNISNSGLALSNFIKGSEWVQFVLYNPKNANGVNLYPTDGNYAEKYVLDNVNRLDFHSHLFVDQPNPDTSFATRSDNFASIDYNFTASGAYISYASSSGTPATPTLQTDITESIPQGFFPSSSTGYPTLQYFRGWAGANFYQNGSLVGTSGQVSDVLQGFNSGSTERDKDGGLSYEASTLPFFINATASVVRINSSSFLDYSTASNQVVEVGPIFKTAGGKEIKYYYEETTGKIYISGSNALNTKKLANNTYNALLDVELVPFGRATTTYYPTTEGTIIAVTPSQSLWLTRGMADPGVQDGNYWLYNRHYHRPFKVYALTTTGSDLTGYGNDEYTTGSYGNTTSSVGPPPNELLDVFIAYSESRASFRNDGVYQFANNLTETVQLNAEVSLGFRSNTVQTPANYGTASYSDSVDSKYGFTGSSTDLRTWETASLIVYKNGSILVTESISNLSASLETGIRFSASTNLSPTSVKPGDTLQMALSVNNEQSGFNSALLATSYTMSISSSRPQTSDLVPVTYENYLGPEGDCDPLINNIVGDRPNARLQDVDYSVGINDPINFSQIIKDEAVRATVPESNFTQIGFANQRYFGSSTTRDNVNEYNPTSFNDQNNKLMYLGDQANPFLSNMGKGPTLGKIANVELRNAYIAYYSKIVDPYPTLNNKTAYYVKYLIDDQGQIFDPTLSDINFSIFENTFKLYDYDLKPTRVKTSVQNIKEAKELSRLNKGINPVYKLGEYPVPVLYSQTSSLGHTNNIILSGSPFYGTLGLGAAFVNYAGTINHSQSYSQPGDNKASVNFASSEAAFETFVPFESNINQVGGGPIIPTGSVANEIEFPLDPSGSLPNTRGGQLSDDYRIDGSFSFFTSTIPGRFRRGIRSSFGDDWGDRDLYTRGESITKYRQPFAFDLEFYSTTLDTTTLPVITSKSAIGVNVSSVTLTIIESLGAANERQYPPLTFEKYPTGYNAQWYIQNGALKLRPDSLYVEDLIAIQILGRTSANTQRRTLPFETLVGGGYWDSNSDGTNTTGYGGIPIYYKWTINFSKSGLKQGSRFKLKYEGNFTLTAYMGGSDRNKDFFMLAKADRGFNRESQTRTRTFNPTAPNSTSALKVAPALSYVVTSPLSAGDQNTNGAPGPFWRRVPGTTDRLYMSSSILNQTYAIYDQDGNITNGNYYTQAKLPYKGDMSVDFPQTKEPAFVQFDPVEDPWSVFEGDEIRFENNENFVYRVTSVDGIDGVFPPTNPQSELVADKLQVVVRPPFEYTASDGNIIQKEPSNFDFFVQRRFKENKNFIILEQQKPYGPPVVGDTTDVSGSGAQVSQSSSPGILLPQHRIPKYNVNPDEVLKDLIEKKII